GVRRGDNFRTEGARHASGIRRDRILQDPSAHDQDDQDASRQLTPATHKFLQVCGETNTAL
ncbi:hypothetical protein Cfor_09097, partial [Coptotermes formosanus]